MRFISTLISIFITTIKWILIKIIHPKKFSFNIFGGISLVSPFVQLEFRGKGKILFGSKIRIGKGSKVFVRDNGVITVGNNTLLGCNNSLVAHEKIYIGNNCQFAPNVFIYDHDHDFRTKNGLWSKRYKTSPVIIGNNVWIGVNTVVLRGTTIGDNCIIGAGSIIKGIYPANSIIVQKKAETIIPFEVNDE